MRSVSSLVTIFCIINLVRGQTEPDYGESEVLGNSEWWSNRITKINRKQPIGLTSEDSGRQERRWEDHQEETEEHRKRPRPFALRVSETRDRFEPQRGDFRKGKEDGTIGELLKWEPAAPSPILLPPYAFTTPEPVMQKSAFDANDAQSPWKNESSQQGKSNESSAVDRIRVYEITTFNSSSNEKVNTEVNYDDKDSSKLSDNESKSRWVDSIRTSSSNATRTRKQKSDDRDGQNPSRSFYIDEVPEKKQPESSKPASSRDNNSIKRPRGSRKYQHDFEAEKTSMRKHGFTSTVRYNWQRSSSTQRSNSRFKYSDDNAAKVGAVPGVPGRDYPVHQEHVHHNLRNVADRFPCPRTPKTHVYLADRASRCQIFYVCYGSKTGVPMVCPNGTLFSEPLQVCDWWYNVSC